MFVFVSFTLLSSICWLDLGRLFIRCVQGSRSHSDDDSDIPEIGGCQQWSDRRTSSKRSRPQLHPVTPQPAQQHNRWIRRPVLGVWRVHWGEFRRWVKTLFQFKSSCCAVSPWTSARVNQRTLRISNSNHGQLLLKSNINLCNLKRMCTYSIKRMMSICSSPQIPTAPKFSQMRLRQLYLVIEKRKSFSMLVISWEGRVVKVLTGRYQLFCKAGVNSI